MSRPSIHNLTICSPYLVGYETVAVGEMEDLVSDEDTDTGNIDEDTKESILAQAAAEAADAVAEEDAVPFPTSRPAHVSAESRRAAPQPT